VGMSGRATVLAFAIVVLAIGSLGAAEEAALSAPPSRAVGDLPVATQTRLVVDLSQTVELRAFTLANPYRVVLDLPQVRFQLPARTGEKGRGLVKAFRY